MPSLHRKISLYLLLVLTFWAIPPISPVAAQTDSPPDWQKILHPPASQIPHESTGSVVCRKVAAIGFEEEAERAHDHLPSSTTSVPSEAVVFVTVHNGSLYLHSNYISRPPSDPNHFTYPTKIATDQVRDLQSLAYNIVGNYETSGFSQEEFLDAFPKMRFIVEERLFQDSKYGRFDFSDAPNVAVIGEDGVTRRSEEISNPDGSTKRIVQRVDNLYSVVGDQNVASVFERMKSGKVRQETIRLVSLVKNRATKNSIAKLPKEIVLDAGDLSASAIEAVISSQPGMNLFLLGHIEQNDFVVRDEKGKQLSRVPISDLLAAANAAKVRLFMLGCNSATIASAGVATKFNTVDAVNRFATAIGTKNWLDFYNQLASPELKLVLDASVPVGNKTDEVTLTVHSSEHDNETVGSIRHYLPPTIGLSTPGTNNALQTDNTPQKKNDDDEGWWVVTGIFALVSVGVIVALIKRKS